MANIQKITPFLWFDRQAEEAVKFYTSIFKNSKVGKVTRYGKEGYEIHKMPDRIELVEFEKIQTAGENISFVVRKTGTKANYTVTTQMINVDTGNVVDEYNFDRTTHNPADAPFEHKIEFPIRMSRIAIDNPGDYILKIESGNNVVQQKFTVVPDRKLSSEPEPGPIQEDNSKDETINHVEEILSQDYRSDKPKIQAINEYIQAFELGFFVEQFSFGLKPDYEEGEEISFVFAEWGFQEQPCTLPHLKMYLRSYDNYSAIQKIHEWKAKPHPCPSPSPETEGSVILNYWRMSDMGFSDDFEYKLCTTPGEYKIFASSDEDEKLEHIGAFTCMRDSFTDKTQPWTDLPE